MVDLMNIVVEVICLAKKIEFDLEINMTIKGLLLNLEEVLFLLDLNNELVL